MYLRMTKLLLGMRTPCWVTHCFSLTLLFCDGLIWSDTWDLFLAGEEFCDVIMKRNVSKRSLEELIVCVLLLRCQNGYGHVSPCNNTPQRLVRKEIWFYLQDTQFEGAENVSATSQPHPQHTVNQPPPERLESKAKSRGSPLQLLCPLGA